MLLRELALGDADKRSKPDFRGQQVVAAGVEPAVGHVVADRQQVGGGVVEEVEVHGGELARAQCQFGDQLQPALRLGAAGADQLRERLLVRAFARRQRGAGRGSGAQARARAKTGQLAQGRNAGQARVDDVLLRRRHPRRQCQQFVAHVAAVGGQLFGPAAQVRPGQVWPGQVRRRGRRPVHCGEDGVGIDAQRREELGQARQGVRAVPGFGQVALHRDDGGDGGGGGGGGRGAVDGRGLERLLGHHLQRDFDAVQGTRPGDRLVGQRRQARRERQQVAGQVAAVDGRHVHRLQRHQRHRVVPVVEVAVVALHLVHRAEGGGGAREHLAERGETEVPGAQVGQQRHAHVGWRRAVGHDHDRMLLHVVGWQPVVAGADEVLEKPPGLARQRMQEQRVGVAQFGALAHHRQADPPGDERRHEPQQQQRGGGEQRARVGEPEHQRGADGQRRREPHAAPVGCHVGRRARQARWAPFEQVAARDEHAIAGARDGVDAEPGFVRQENGLQRGMAEHDSQAR